MKQAGSQGSGRLVLLSQGLAADVQNLQPWRTLLELARHLAARGRSLLVLSDQAVEGLNGHGLEFASLPAWNAKTLGERLRAEQPSCVLWGLAPTSLRHARLLDELSCPVVALLLSPAYSWRQLLGVLHRCAPGELRSLLLQQCVPSGSWRRFLMHPSVALRCVVSENSLAHLLRIGLPAERTVLLRVGLDDDLREEARGSLRAASPRAETRFVYLGGAKKIRGFFLLLDAIRRLGSEPESEGIEFTLLARGAHESLAKEVQAGLPVGAPKVRLLTGTLERDALLQELREADAVLLPFLLAPSDVPIAVLEAMALGKPVVSTRIDGIPELLEDRGVLLQRRSSRELARELLALHRDPERRGSLGDQARAFAAEYPTWSESLESFAGTLEESLKP